MAKPRKKKLPKDFERLLESAELSTLRAVFDSCAIDARAGYNELTALMMPACPDELAQWLVAQGADVRATSKYGKTALHERAYFPQYSLQTLIDLGCDIHASCSQGTALHIAAERNNHEGLRLLLQAGAKVDAKNDSGNTPLEHALACCQNSSIKNMPRTAQMLLDAGAAQSNKTKTFVEKIGQNFEWYRDKFNPASLEVTDAALYTLYKLFDVSPAPRRVMYDGHSPIVTRASEWRQAHQELWEVLVPATGPAETVQGEVIRIAGRISSELYRNGGGNWDRDYRRMADSFLTLITMGQSLNDDQVRDCRQLISELPKRDDADFLVAMSVAWVKLNSDPIKLGPVEYMR